MRDIEFRGFYTGDPHFDKGFVYGYFIGGKQSSIMEKDGHMCWSVEPESIGQFTGLLDKNGTKIFGKDVVYIAGYGNYVCEFPFLELYEAAAENDIGEILGNVFENPELLDEN